tara:strand:- start:45 stop:458 length:414 start_codon:yes stop_codon:yes gene_type:complete
MFFLDNKEDTEKNNLIKVAALLIYTAKIDENYSNQEEQIIRESMIQLGSKKEEIEELIIEAKKIEENSNQILEFTKEVKNLSNDKKIKIVETLWKIIYSNKDADIYETNLMRRLSGLLYIDSKVMGDIKERIKGENS